jgi:hypothetical protein
MPTSFIQSSAIVLERAAYAFLAATTGVGLLSIIVIGFRPSLVEAMAGKPAAAQMACEQPGASSTFGAIPVVQGPVAAVAR